MNSMSALYLGVALTAGIVTTAYAAVGSEQAREANARNAAGTATETAPTMKAPNDPAQRAKPGWYGQTAPSGRSVGPGAGGDSANTPLGYAKGPGENNPVGKDR